MKRLPIIPLFISVHIVCIVMHIYKQSLFVQTSYTKQTYEREYESLQQEKQLLSQELQTLKNRTNIKKYAQTHLDMDTLKLKQIQKIPDYEEKL